jgi:hypothetical protein
MVSQSLKIGETNLDYRIWRYRCRKGKDLGYGVGCLPSIYHIYEENRYN